MCDKAACAKACTPEMEKILKETFCKYDKDHSGTVDVKDMKAIMEEVFQKAHITDCTPEQACAEMQKHCGGCPSGKIPYAEFCKSCQNACPSVCMKTCTPEMEKCIKEVFCKYDKDHSGSVDVKDMHNIVMEIFEKGHITDCTPDKACAEMQKHCGGCPTGKIPYAEFCNACAKCCPSTCQKQCTPEMEKILKETFCKYDKDHSGKVDVKDMKAIMEEVFQKAHITDCTPEKACAEMQKHCGACHSADGKISYEDFAKGCANSCPSACKDACSPLMQKCMKEAFEKCDKDHCGKIDAKDLHTCVEEMCKKGHVTECTPDQMCANMSKMCGHCPDGKVSYEEFCKAAQTCCPAACKKTCTPEMEKCMKEAFDKVDKDHTGKVDCKDLKPVIEEYFKKSGITNCTVDQACAAMAEKCSGAPGGKVSYEEFKAACEKCCPATCGAACPK